jgi:3-phenylpropionate/trans-cinnamate dioxygenase ferredoxin subunit
MPDAVSCFPSSIAERKVLMAKHIVATAAEIPPGSRKIVDIGGRSIGVFNVNGEFFALRNHCPHQGGPLCDGKLSGLFQADRPGEYQYSRPGEILRCPWHGWEFDIRNGQSWFDPAKPRVRKYEVSVEPGAELEPDELAAASGYQKGPYTAATFAVTVEEQYVVLEV